MSGDNLQNLTVIVTSNCNLHGHSPYMDRSQPCCLFEYIYANKVKEIANKDFFILHGEAFMALLKVLNSFVRKDIFIGDRPFFAPIFVFYLSKSINPLAKREFNRQVYILMENGHVLKAFSEGDHMIDRESPPIKTIFRNAGEFVKFYTLISDVKMNDFTFVYLFYGFWSLTLFIFALHCNICHIRLLLRTRDKHIPANVRTGSARRILNRKKEIPINAHLLIMQIKNRNAPRFRRLLYSEDNFIRTHRDF